MGKIDFDDLQSVRSYNEIRAYNQSKLANLVFTYELARRIAGTGVTANAVEPGFVKPNLKVPFPFSLFAFMETKSSKMSYDEGMARRLWQVSEELTTLGRVRAG